MIQVEHLTKRYGGHTAVDDISFTVEDGCIYGLLGPNGAGKSTTMNIITGYLSATDGTVTINGHDIAEEPAAAKACIGYLPEQPPLYQDMTVREYLLFVAELKGTRKKADRIAAVENACARTGLQEMEGRLIRNLSKGYRQRVGIAGALLGTPKVIILDEPTVGLDPAQMIEIRSLIHDLGKTHTVILSSHILSEVQTVCDRVLIIAHGKLVAQGTPEELAGKLAAKGTISATAQGERDAVLAAAENHYGRMTADALGAEYRVVSASGWGLVSGWDNDPRCTLAPCYTQVCGLAAGERNAALGAQQPYDFAAWPADAVIVNLGTNDWNAFHNPPWVDPETGRSFKQTLADDGSFAPADAARLAAAVRNFWRWYASTTPTLSSCGLTACWAAVCCRCCGTGWTNTAPSAVMSGCICWNCPKQGAIPSVPDSTPVPPPTALRPIVWRSFCAVCCNF